MKFTEKKLAILFLFLVIWSIISIIGLTWGNRIDWPDNVHIDYGFPTIWATNTLSTISGPVNIWTVNIESLIFNLAFWLGVMLVVSLALIYLEKISKID